MFIGSHREHWNTLQCCVVLLPLDFLCLQLQTLLNVSLVDNTGLMAWMMLCMLRVSQARLTWNYLLRGSKKISKTFRSSASLLLLIDGHKSHMSLELVDLCRTNM